MLRTYVAALALAVAGTAAVAQAQLIPAQPQPDPATLKPGLAVRYTYPHDIRYLGDVASYMRKEAEPGLPIVGFDYPDNDIGQAVLTARRGERIGAEIEGFLRFDQPGRWRLEFHSNDGLDVTLGAMRVYTDDGRHTCRTTGWVDVTVPEAGWYPVEATWFQRLNTACLMLRWQRPDGVTEWTTGEHYAFRPK